MFKNNYINEPFYGDHCVFEFVNLYFNNVDNKWYIYTKDKSGKIHKTSFNTKEEALNRWNETVRVQSALLKDCVLLTVSKSPEENKSCIFDYVNYIEKNGKFIIEVKEKKTGLVKQTFFDSKMTAMNDWHRIVQTESAFVKDCVLIDLTNTNINKDNINSCPFEYVYFHKINNNYIIETKHKLDGDLGYKKFDNIEDAHNYYKLNVNKNCKLTDKTLHNIHAKDATKNVNLEEAKLYKNNDLYYIEILENKKYTKNEFQNYEMAKKYWDFVVLKKYENNTDEFIKINKELTHISDKLLKVDSIDFDKLNHLLKKYEEHSKFINEMNKYSGKYKMENNHLGHSGELLGNTAHLIHPGIPGSNMFKNNIDINKINKLEIKLKEYINKNNNNKAILEDIYSKLLEKNNPKNKPIMKKISKTLKCPACPPSPLYAITNPVSVMEIQNQRVGSIVKNK